MPFSCSYCTHNDHDCRRPSTGGLLCTRQRDHIGPHVACGWNDHQLATWRDDEVVIANDKSKEAFDLLEETVDTCGNYSFDSIDLRDVIEKASLFVRKLKENKTEEKGEGR